MKSVSEMRHLEQFGIKPLTGEADALGFRILCDLDEQGVIVFKECFGIPHGRAACDGPMMPTGLADNWNSGSIASVMLTGHDIVPLAIMGFYLQGHTVIVARYKDGYEHAMALEEGEAVALNDAGDGYVMRHGNYMIPWPSCYGEIIRIIRQKTSDGRVVQGTRNVHQFTGRMS